MNLAEIRKKANRDREDSPARPVNAQPVASEIRTVQEENDDGHVLDSTNPDLETHPDWMSEIGITEDADFVDASPDLVLEERPEAEALSLPARTIATPELPVSASDPALASSATPQRTESASVSSPEPETGHGTLFDPIAILMAGRASFGYGDELEIAADDAVDTEVADYQEFLCFRVGNEQYAINIMEIKEIIKPREITEVPRAPDFITGVLSLRGVIIPVFNMGKRLHLESVRNSSRERIIVVSKGDELCGIQVDEVLQVVRIQDGCVEQPPAVLEGIDRDFVNGIGRHSSGMLILLNLVSILDVSLY